nr:UPF0149 family protein [uncultured Gellertiella sp.]
MDEPEGFSELPEVAARMDDALEALDTDEGGMLLSELNGYLCGIILSPEPIEPSEWLPEIWDADEVEDQGPFESDEDRKEFVATVMAYYNSLVAELDNNEFEPIFDVDGEDNSVIWEIWILGFTRAYDLRQESWMKFIESDDEETSEAMMQLLGLVAVADPDIESEEPVTEADLEEIHEAAPDLIPYAVTALYHGRKSTH